MTQIEKSSVFKRLEFDSVDSMDIALIQFADTLKAEGKEVAEELQYPDRTTTISSENLKLFHTYMRQALTAPALPQALDQPEEEIEPPVGITSAEPQCIATNGDYNRDRLSGLTNVLTQLGFEIGMMVGTALSEEKWDAIEEAYEQNDQRRLTEFVNAHRNEFESVESLLSTLDSKRSSRRAGTLGKLTELGNLSDLSSRRKKALTR